MAYNPPIAYFLTWTTYGTRLAGDHRGSVDKEHAIHGSPFLPPNFRYENLRRHQLSEEPLLLDAPMRGTVHRAIENHAKVRGWHLHAQNVRTNHVHIVVSAAMTPGRMLAQFKAYATRALREQNLIGERKHVWTEDGSKKWLFTDAHVADCCNYVIYGQGDDLPME